MKTPALLCLRFQALAEALKINASVAKIDLRWNQIGDEGAKAWCVVGSSESLNAAACHDVMSPTSFDSDKFGWFGGAVVSSFIFHRKESCQICRCCKQLSISALLAKFCIREIHMSELNVNDLNSRTLDEDASLALSPFPGLGRGAEDKLVRHEHSFEIEPDWRRGGQGLVCGMGAAESLNAAASHDVMFSTSCDSDKFGWFGGPVVSSFIFHRKESCQICRCCKLLLISGVFLQGFNQRDLQVLVKLNVLWSEDFRSKVLSVEHLKSRRQP